MQHNHSKLGETVECYCKTVKKVVTRALFWEVDSNLVLTGQCGNRNKVVICQVSGLASGLVTSQAASHPQLLQTENGLKNQG